MTEAEAKRKWCPMINADNLSALHDGPSGKPRSACIGSACMMWRWQKKSAVKFNYNTGQFFNPAPLNDDGNLRGFCGLAGKP